MGIILTQLMGSLLPAVLQLFFQGKSFAQSSYYGIFQSLGLILVGIGFLKIGEKTWLLQRQTKHYLLFIVNPVSLFFNDPLIRS